MTPTNPERDHRVRRAIAVAQLIGQDDLERIGYWLDHYRNGAGATSLPNVSGDDVERPPVAVVAEPVAAADGSTGERETSTTVDA